MVSMMRHSVDLSTKLRIRSTPWPWHGRFHEADAAITAGVVLFDVRDALRRVTAGAAVLYAI